MIILLKDGKKNFLIIRNYARVLAATLWCQIRLTKKLFCHFPKELLGSNK